MQLSEQQLSSKVGLYWNRDSDGIRKLSLKDGGLQLISPDGAYEMRPLSENRFRVVGQPIELRFESATPGRPQHLAEIFRGGDPRFFEPVNEFTHTRAELREYVGTYVSDEAEAVYRVALQDDKLVLSRPRRKTGILEPTVRDLFSMPGWTIRFARDSNNRISGMLFNRRFGIRNFRFTKQTP